MVGPAPLISIPVASPMPAAARPIPSSMFQFWPHTPFAAMQARVPELADMGFGAIHFAPLGPPSAIDVGGKYGSAYAPRDHLGLAPFLWDQARPVDTYAQWGMDVPPVIAANSRILTSDGPHDLARRFTDGDRERLVAPYADGWAALTALMHAARSHGMGGVADLVLSHGARDPVTLAAYANALGQDVYMRAGDGYIERLGAHDAFGRWEWWDDIARFNHTGPAQDQLVNYFTLAVGLMLHAGVTIFRVDAATFIPEGFLRRFLERARTFADRAGLPRPAVYAEVHSSNEQASLNERMMRTGFDGVTSAVYNLRGPRDQRFLADINTTFHAGGQSVGYVANHDTRSFADAHPTARSRVAQLALTTLFYGSSIVMDGSLDLMRDHRPSVFLNRRDDDRVRWTDRAGAIPSPGEESRALHGMMGAMLALQRRYPILGDTGFVEMTVDGEAILFRKTTLTDQAVIAHNPTDHLVSFAVSEPGFQDGLVFYAFVDESGRIIYNTDAMRPISSYSLPPGGIAVFQRSLAPEETSPIPAEYAPMIDTVGTRPTLVP